MTLSVQAKAQIVEGYRRFDGDTGSPEVQVALLTSRINYLTEHLRDHKKDKHSRRGLMNLVARRRKLLDYVKRTKPETYKKLLDTLGLRR
ncbi:30S ribosomal protein S15 [Candidatus Berkiella cookevillensis]|uniref:Small ribosomal subunit protein uS15 n=1 Tax=Candidatus Berkiella cookevillensis TaxID=437022 RepID=A0A0Q9YPU9_9GAMM|nr:30S ribosomal protein S15 [Candidatus Berkiella cookevillensis]MCS5707855.1 30S ribosomal protein S15 [Candidatus Berkiella cookevillensis]